MKYLTLILFMALTSNGGCQDKKNTTNTIIPTCIQEKIKQFSEEKVANPPRKIYQYTYNEKIVYLISAPCCDQFEQLVDQNCKILCSPSGGFTGKGDGKCIDFSEKASHEKLIWEDTRKSQI